MVRESGFGIKGKNPCVCSCIMCHTLTPLPQCNKAWMMMSMKKADPMSQSDQYIKKMTSGFQHWDFGIDSLFEDSQTIAVNTVLAFR